MATSADFVHNIKPPMEYSLVDKRVLVDELGRARDPSTGAIVNLGRRERLPLASEDKYARQVKLKEDFASECYELREQVAGLRRKLEASEKHASALEDAQGPLLEEISYLRSVTSVIYEKHRIDAYHNLGLGMKNQRLEMEVGNLRSNSERFASGLPSLLAPETVTQTVEKTVYVENTDKIAELQAQLDKLKVLEGFEFGQRVYQCVQDPPGVGYRFTPLFEDKNTDGGGPQSPQVFIADAVLQGPKAIFARCISGRGWLPLTNPSGDKILFKHLGRVEDVDMSQYEVNDGKTKV